MSVQDMLAEEIPTRIPTTPTAATRKIEPSLVEMI